MFMFISVKDKEFRNTEYWKYNIFHFFLLFIDNNYTYIGISYISSFISNHRSLEQCIISRLVDGDKSICTFSELINNRISIERLSITNSNFTSIGMSELCNAFINMRLFELTLNGNNISGITMKYFSDNLSLLTSLELLSLSNCRINDSDVNYFIRWITSIRRLNIFDLSSIYSNINNTLHIENNISDIGVGYISHSFHVLSNLEKLELNSILFVFVIF